MGTCNATLQKPAWLEFIDGRVDRLNPSDLPERPLLGVIRYLLLASNSDLEAMSIASEEVRRIYHIYYHANYQHGRELCSAVVIEEAAGLVLQMTGTISVDDVRHNRLFDFLARLRIDAREDEDLDSWNPKFIYNKMVVGRVAHDIRSTFIGYNPNECNEWHSFSYMVAKMLGQGLIDPRSIGLAVEAIELGVGEGTTEPWHLDDSLRQCRELAAANYIILAGDVLFSAAKDPSAVSIEADTWKEWTRLFGKIAYSDDVSVSGGRRVLRRMLR